MSRVDGAAEGPLRERIARYLAERHTATVATVGPDGMPHAATVYYTVDAGLDLLFVSKADSRHGQDIRRTGRVAVTVTDSDQPWRDIRGVQLWGSAERLGGATRLKGLARYTARFPFAREIAGSGAGRRLLDEVEVFRIRTERAAFTDNTTGLLGREVLGRV